MNIRDAGPADASIIHSFVTDLAKYERMEDQVKLSVEDYERYLQNGGHFNAFIADKGDQAVGMALWYKRFSTWVGDYAYLEDLYVDPESRGEGIGPALMQHLGAHALSMGMQRMEWQVLDWNEPAVKMYKSIGANILPDWRVCQLDEVAIAAFVGQR